MEKDGGNPFFFWPSCKMARKWLRGESVGEGHRKLLSDVDSDEFVAKLQIRPPSNDLPAICMLEDQKEGFVDDPISMCVVGGIRHKVKKICDQNKAIGGRKCNKYVICSYFVFFILILSIAVLFGLLEKSQSDEDYGEDGNEDNRSAWIRFIGHVVIFAISISGSLWITRNSEKMYRSSEEFLNSKRAFWESWNQSGIQMELEETLAECGYSVQVVPNEYYWNMTVRKVGSQQSLPPANSQIYVIRPASDEEVVSSSGFFMHQNESRVPLDTWTHQGLKLGICLSTQMHSRTTTTIFSILVCCWGLLWMYVLWFKEDMFLLLSFFWIAGVVLTIVVSRTFFECIDRPQVTSAHRLVIHRFSELIQPRHGCRVEYEIRPAIHNCLVWKKVVIKYVQEEQA